jgi:enoyl-CoA hydratase/carnithine racemase
MADNLILAEKQDNIGIITLNRPDAMNGFNVPFAQQLNDALKTLDQDEDVRVIVIRSSSKHFSTGISLTEFKDKSHGEYRRFIRQMDEHNHTIADMQTLVIASVSGYAIANGAGLVYSCDMAIAAEDAKFGTTAINVGLICLGPAVPMSRCIGRKKTLEMVLTGDMIPAEEAARLGLINKVVPPEALEEETMKFARKLAAKSPQSLKIGKKGIYGMADLPYHQALDYMSELFASLCVTEDAAEGVNSFQEKRTPQWKNQ